MKSSWLRAFKNTTVFIPVPGHIKCHPYYVAIDSTYVIFFSFPQGKDPAMFIAIDLFAGHPQPQHAREVFLYVALLASEHPCQP